MQPHEIKHLRTKLGLGQTEFAQLFGVHPMTISRWELGTLIPSAYHEALMRDFKSATAKNDSVGNALKGILIGAGIVAALYFLLKTSRE